MLKFWVAFDFDSLNAHEAASWVPFGQHLGRLEMSETRVVGVALFHRVGLRELLDQHGEQLLAFFKQPPQLFIGDDARGPASLEALQSISLPDLSLGGDRALRLRDEAAGSMMEVFNPAQSHHRGLAPHLLGLILPEADLDLEALYRLAEALDLRYGFAHGAASVEAAYDEVFWPAGPGLRSLPQGRRHSNAWIQLMRAFGRPEIGNGVPEVYWLNIFGANLINALRRNDCWESLEQAASLRYLSCGVAIPLAGRPSEVDKTKLQTLGDIVAPLGLMQRALQQARQGDQLLLNALVATGDKRLLKGLAFPDGLEAFAQLAGLEPGSIERVDQALAWLEREANNRPRSYGEAWPCAVEEPPQEPAAAAPATAPAPATPQAPTEPAKESAEEPAAGADLGPKNWTLRTISRGAVRIELASVQWTAESATYRDRLEVGLVNASPRPITVAEVRAVCLQGETPIAMSSSPAAEFELATAGRTRCHVDVPAARPDQRLVVSASLGYELDESVSDLDLREGRIHLLADDTGLTGMSSWPTQVWLGAEGRELYAHVINTTQDPWQRWQLCVVAPGGEVSQSPWLSVLTPGASAYVKLALPADLSGPMQLCLRASVSVKIQLAVFEPT